MYEAAVDIVIREGRGSVSLLQRSLGIGYGRAARLIDYMAEDGIVGTYNGSQAREVLVTLEQLASDERRGRRRRPSRRSCGATRSCPTRSDDEEPQALLPAPPQARHLHEPRTRTKTR